MKYRHVIITIILIALSTGLFSQNLSYQRQIKWLDIYSLKDSETDSINILTFEGANFNAKTGLLPVYFERFVWDNEELPGDIILKNQIFEVIEPDFAAKLDNIDGIGSDINIQTSINYQRKEPFLSVSFVPVRKNLHLDLYEKLVSFEIEFLPSLSTAAVGFTSIINYTDKSVLSSGNWFKIAVQNRGIHKITYQDLSGMGIDPGSINPANIRIYGNGGGMLPEINDAFRYDDLQENAILVAGEGDGQFNQSDYILFYGESPNTWEYNLYRETFEHTNHLYSDYTYYYITTDLGKGKRIETIESTHEEVTHTVTTFNDFAGHEVNDVNLIKSGRKWYGEIFDFLTTYDFSFDFPNIDKSSLIGIKTVVAARSTVSSSFTVSADGNNKTASISAVSVNYNSQYARQAIITDEFIAQSSKIDVSVKYNKTTSGSIGWLHYIEVNARRALRFTGDNMPFRDGASMGYENVAEYRLSNAPTDVTIWEVTDPLNIRKINAEHNNNTQTFKLESDSVREFVAFNGKQFYSVGFIETVANQNLHGLSQQDFVIVSHPLFLDQAERLADFHRDLDGYKTVVVTPQQIYNEFSSGAQDISAIRNFMKMFYDRATSGDEPKFLLLYGDGSYDNKDRLSDNTNFIPTYQSAESLHPIVSYVTDDFYGFLDDGEGSGDNEMLDLGIGRLPVSSVEEAEEALTKIIHYTTPSDETMGDWRNTVCFIADDEDSHIHFIQAENLATYVDTAHPVYNINKIYLDAYSQISTPGGQRYPSVNEAINEQVEKGALMINYTGHGGEVGWAHERILEIADISNWDNFDNMPVFVTATCEFSRFDDPERTSAGELVILNPNGGGLALFTTSRATFGSPNYNLNRRLYENAFRKIDGKFPTMGDILMLSKQQSGSDNNGKKFILLGDPAQRMVYPEYNVIATEINYNPVSETPDTISALSQVTIKGEVLDNQGNKMNEFDGVIFTTVFDKPITINTQGNDGGSSKRFSIQKSILYKGKTTVEEGGFELTFVVPKDIAYQYGFGKISFYSCNGTIDANGYYKNLMIGGYDDTVVTDDIGPEIRLFINNEYFVEGGITDENPVLLALISDENGINTVGNGIGHDITAILDGNTDDIRVLNDYYESDLNTFKSGRVTFPFFNLSQGHHSIVFKVWDVFNNSSEATISFAVSLSGEFVFEDLLNYPNPFSEYTHFTFSHNQTEQYLDVEINIFALTGQFVTQLSSRIYANGYKPEPIIWDGKDAKGAQVSNGVYIYTIHLRNEKGESSQKSEKLIISRQNQ
jgi:hypothetical protein